MVARSRLSVSVTRISSSHTCDSPFNIEFSFAETFGPLVRQWPRLRRHSPSGPWPWGDTMTPSPIVTRRSA